MKSSILVITFDVEVMVEEAETILVGLGASTESGYGPVFGSAPVNCSGDSLSLILNRRFSSFKRSFSSRKRLNLTSSSW